MDRPPPLAAILRAERAVERIEAFRRASRRPVPEAELRRCYDLRREALGDPGLDAIRPELESRIRSNRFAERLVKQLDQLASRVEVRYAPPFTPRPFSRVDPCPSAEAIRGEEGT